MSAKRIAAKEIREIVSRLCFKHPGDASLKDALLLAVAIHKVMPFDLWMVKELQGALRASGLMHEADMIEPRRGDHMLEDIAESKDPVATQPPAPEPKRRGLLDFGWLALIHR